jgi:hypothetical protein
MAGNRSIALAAVVVTGVVGVAGPYITWKAIRDTGKLASRTILVQSDRADFRQVLDEAALVLRQQSDAFDALAKEWADGDRPLGRDRLFGFEGRLQRMGASAERLGIRLGTDAPLYVAYSKALADIKVLSDRVRRDPTAAKIKSVQSRKRVLHSNSVAFYRLANEQAGSILR